MSNTSSSNYDFWTKYRNISTRLKKRMFLRKPNTTEAAEQFRSLALHCENECDEFPQYAALSWLAAARCEGSLGNSPAEAWDLVRAARKFRSAEEWKKPIASPSCGLENLQAAVNCYSLAADRWQHHHTCEQQSISTTLGHPKLKHPVGSPLSAGLILELGCSFEKEYERIPEASSLFRTAAEMQKTNPLQQINNLGLLASTRIKLGDYDGALSIFNKITAIADFGDNQPFGVYSDILLRCEITRILLLLILQPSAQRLSIDLEQVLEKYAWNEDGVKSQVSFLSDNQFLLLQSLVMACQAHDIESLISLESSLWKYLSMEQRQLLHVLVKNTTNI